MKKTYLILDIRTLLLGGCFPFWENQAPITGICETRVLGQGLTVFRSKPTRDK